MLPRFSFHSNSEAPDSRSFLWLFTRPNTVTSSSSYITLGIDNAGFSHPYEPYAITVVHVWDGCGFRVPMFPPF